MTLIPDSPAAVASSVGLLQPGVPHLFLHVSPSSPDWLQSLRAKEKLRRTAYKWCHQSLRPWQPYTQSSLLVQENPSDASFILCQMMKTNPSTGKAEAGGPLRIDNQSGLQSDTLSQNK